MKIALVQMDVAHGQPVENKKHVKEMLERTLDDNPDVIVLPEMWNTGYALDELNGLADKEGLDSQELLSHFARKHAVAIIGGSVAIEKDGKFYNTTYVYNKSGDLIIPTARSISLASWQRTSTCLLGLRSLYLSLML